jgi:hypothetical protein
MHLRLFNRPPTFTMIAMGAGSHQVVPGMVTPQVAWNDVVNREVRYMLTAILAGIVIPPQDFALGQLNLGSRAVDHLFQADDGRAREDLPNGLNLTASIQDQAGFPINHQYWCLHSCHQAEIIAHSIANTCFQALPKGTFNN